MMRPLLAAASALALSACVAGPNYRVPEQALAKKPAAQDPFLNARNGALRQDPPPPHWWRLYDDARLDGYVAEALAANRDLRAADANFRRATFVVREAQAGRLPVTTLSASAGPLLSGRTGGPVSDALAYDLGGSVSYPLDLAGGLRRGIEAARDDSEAALAARDMVRVTVAAAVAKSFADACSANATLAATQHVIDLQRQTLEVVRRLFLGGRASALDAATAQAALDQSTAAVAPIVASREASLYELAALMGRAPADYPHEAETCDAPPALKGLLPVGDGAALIRRRPDVRQAERTLAAATAGVGVQMAQLYPQVSLGGSAGISAPVSGTANASQVSLSLGPLLTWTFPNRAVAHARIGEAGAAAEEASAQFDAAVIAALQQTETSLSAYAREIDHNRSLRRTRDDNTKAADLAKRLYQTGRTNLVNWLTAQSNLAVAQAALSQSDAALADRQIDVFLALGGGWE